MLIDHWTRLICFLSSYLWFKWYIGDLFQTNMINGHPRVQNARYWVHVSLSKLVSLAYYSDSVQATVSKVVLDCEGQAFPYHTTTKLPHTQVTISVTDDMTKRVTYDDTCRSRRYMLHTTIHVTYYDTCHRRKSVSNATIHVTYDDTLHTIHVIDEDTWHTRRYVSHTMIHVTHNVTDDDIYRRRR